MKTFVGDRGLADYANFKDTYGSRVKVRTSSSAQGDRVWIMVGDKDEALDYLDPDGLRVHQHPKTGVLSRCIFAESKPLKAHAAAHLNYEQALAVRDALTEWLNEHEADTEDFNSVFERAIRGED